VAVFLMLLLEPVLRLSPVLVSTVVSTTTRVTPYQGTVRAALAPTESGCVPRRKTVQMSVMPTVLVTIGPSMTRTTTSTELAPTPCLRTAHLTTQLLLLLVQRSRFLLQELSMDVLWITSVTEKSKSGSWTGLLSLSMTPWSRSAILHLGLELVTNHFLISLTPSMFYDTPACLFD